MFWLHGRVVLSFYRLFDVASHISSFIKEQNIRFFVYYRVRYNRTCVYNEKRGGVVYESTVQNDRNGYWRCFNNCYIYWGGLSSRGQAISSEISGNSEGGAALSLANTEDTEIIINELASEIPETGFFALGPDNYHEYTKEELLITMGLNLIFQVFSPT